MPVCELRRVLLADDEPDVRTVALLALERVGGLEVVACTGGRSAVEAIERERPQLVLLDVMMPDLDGPGALAVIRRGRWGAAVPVVFLTAKTHEDEVRRLRALGAVDVIGKPFDPMQLAHQVRRVWERLSD